MSEITHPQNLNIVSPLFDSFSEFDQLIYLGSQKDKIDRYIARGEVEDSFFYIISVMRKEEKILLETCLDMLKQSVENAKDIVRGNFTFQLLSVGVNKGLERFHWADLTTLIINHSRKMKPGDFRVIQYCSSFGLLRMLGESSWGKMKFSHSIQCLSADVEKVDLLFKKIIRCALEEEKKSQMIFYDMSQNPMLCDDNSDQKLRLEKCQKWFGEQKQERMMDLRIIDSKGDRLWG